VAVTRRAPDRPPDLAERKALERLMAELPESGAIPRQDGELAFAEPWELRAVGVTVGLHRAGLFPWADFQQALISTIGEWEATPVEAREPWSYYRHWLRALERLLFEHGVAEPEEVDRKVVECVAAAEHTRSHLKAGLLTVDAAHGTAGRSTSPGRSR
jgi:nitrile hydratase accessory protein